MALTIWDKRYFPEVDFAFKKLATEEKKERFGNVEKEKLSKRSVEKAFERQKWKYDKRPFGEIKSKEKLSIRSIEKAFEGQKVEI